MTKQTAAGEDWQISYLPTNYLPMNGALAPVRGLDEVMEGKARR